MRYVNCEILNAPDNQVTDQIGATIDSNQLISASFMAYFNDSTANGTLYIQASNDHSNPSHWANFCNVAVVNGAVSLIPTQQLSYRWLRAVWTRTSGGSSRIIVNMNALSI